MAKKNTGKPNGRPPHEPTTQLRTRVTLYVMSGTPQDTIAELIGVSADTLRKHYRAELDFGMIEANSKVVGKLYGKAMAGDTAALIFWTKTRMGWKETTDHRHSGPGGGPIQIEKRDFSQFTEEQLNALELAALTFAAGNSCNDGGAG